MTNTPRSAHAFFAIVPSIGALLSLLSIFVLLGGCGIPAIDPARPGFPCNPGGRCQNGLVCVDGSCERPGTLQDAGPDAGDAGDAGSLDAGEDGGAGDGGPTCTSTGATACLDCPDGTACFDGSVTGVCRGQACFDGCLVMGVAYPTGASMSGNACQVCDPAADPTGFSNVSDGLACTDDANPCTDDRCQGGTCLHPPVANSDPCPDDQNPCTDDLCASGSCTHPSTPQGTTCGGTGLCDGFGACSAGCDIGADRYNAGDANPANGCEICDPTTSSSAWTARPDGAACTDDGNACTDDLCASGGCDHPPLPTGSSCSTGLCDAGGACVTSCFIAGVLYPAGSQSPTSPCTVCDPSTALNTWTAASDGSSCDDGDLCNGVSTCQSGTCSQTITPVSCNTPPACMSALGATCDSASGACTYPTLSDGTSCGTSSLCIGGACTLACSIGGALYPPDQINPSNSCQSCQPRFSTTAWSDVADDTGCGPAKACCGGSCISLTGPSDCGACGNRCLTSEICDPTLLVCVPDCNPICP